MEIRTKDADEAAFYWMQEGIDLVGVETKKSHWKNVVWFVFRTGMTESGFEAFRTDYRNCKTFVEPKAYAQKRMEVKNIIREHIFTKR